MRIFVQRYNYKRVHTNVRTGVFCHLKTLLVLIQLSVIQEYVPPGMHNVILLLTYHKPTSLGSLCVNPEDDYNSERLEKFPGPNVLEVSEAELMEDSSLKHGSQVSGAVWAMVVAACVVFFASAIGAALLSYR